VPVIVVFTKMDRLRFREQKRLTKQHIGLGMDTNEAKARAKVECIGAADAAYEESCVKVLQSDLVPRAWKHHCAVSYKRESMPRLCLCVNSDYPFVLNQTLNLLLS
jgi:hypothetical protein